MAEVAGSIPVGWPHLISKGDAEMARNEPDEAIIKKANGRCEYDGCRRKATCIVEDASEDGVGCYCRDHMDVLVGSMSGEYTHNCPNCGCSMSVN